MKTSPLFVFLFLVSVFSQALTANTKDIPASLASWSNWVLHDNTTISCPTNSQGNDKNCVWLGLLQIKLSLNAQQLKFEQVTTVYGESKVHLPGGKTSWPQNVHLLKLSTTSTPLTEENAEQEAIVIQDNDGPYILLEAGSYKITGILSGLDQLHFIALPKEAVLVDLYKQENGSYRLQKNKYIDQHNRLWLKPKNLGTKADKKNISDTLDIQVFRRINDGIPVLMESFYRLNVSGQAREIRINNVLPTDFIAYSFSSKLPAYLDKNNQLVIQVKPGSWTFSVVSRSKGAISEIPFFNQMDNNSTLPSQEIQEIWVFDDNPTLQQVVAKSKHQIDSNQSLMPQHWKKLPAFLMQAASATQKASVLTLELKKRGNDTPPANQLSLSRKLWLDFSGKGFTVQDNITGEMNRDWRLNLLAELEPGKVMLNHQAQQVSYLIEDGQQIAGVEVRNGHIQLSAESRIENTINSISSTGWREDFKKLSATLYLPPGWSIFHASGVDQISPTWINKWSLLDIFVVLLLSIIFYRLWGLKWGIIAFFCFTLLTHKYQLPNSIWFHLVIPISLLQFLSHRDLNQGKFFKFLSWYKNFALIILVLNLVPFWVTELRNSLYPQLHISPYQLNSSTYSSNSPINKQKAKKQQSKKQRYRNQKSDQNTMQDAVELVQEEKSSSAKLRGLSSQFISKTKLNRSTNQRIMQAPLVEYDEEAKIQTGPGLPTWTFNRVNLNWSGPVSQDQRIEFYFISATWNLMLTLLMISLSAALVYLLIQPKRLIQQMRAVLSHPSSNKSIIVSLFIFGFMATNLYLPEVQANTNFPSQYLLDELKTRLLQVEKCYPACISIEKMDISLRDQSLSLRLLVNSQANTSFTLPIDENRLSIKQVLLDNKPFNQFKLKTTNQRSKQPSKQRGKQADKQSRQLQIPVHTGKFQVLIQAEVNSDSFVLPLTVPTHHIKSSLNGWTINGIKNLEPISKQLIFQKDSPKPVRPKPVSPKPVSHATTNATSAKTETGKTLEAIKSIQATKIDGLFKVTRHFYFGLDWTVDTTVERLSDKNTAHNKAQIFYYPLLKGESVLTEQREVKNNQLTVNFTPSQQRFYWRSKLKQGGEIKLIAKETISWVEQWRVKSHPNWHVEFDGIPPILQQSVNKQALFIYQPWPGESLTIKMSRPDVVMGKTKTIIQSKREISFGDGLSSHTLMVDFVSSQSDKQQISLPKNARVLSLKVGRETLAIDENNNVLNFSLPTGKTTVMIKWREIYQQTLISTISTVDLGQRTVNQHLNVKIPHDRVVIYASNAAVGPVILFWGMLVVLLIISYAVSRIPGVPLSAPQALLLAIGIAPISIEALLLIFAWFIVLSRRTFITLPLPKYFNLMQVGLIIMTISTLIAFFYSIEAGLLGYPNLHITGNGSSAYHLNWYTDIHLLADESTAVSFISLPIYAYRILMLLWALWLAFISVRWAIWAWKQYSYLGYWNEIKWSKKLALKNQWNAKKEKDKVDDNADDKAY